VLRQRNMPDRDRDEDLSVREIERQILEMRREKQRSEDTIKRLEVNAKRVLADEQRRAEREAAAAESRGRSRSRSRSGKNDKKEKKRDKSDKSDSGDEKGEKNGKEKDEKDEKEEKDEKDKDDKDKDEKEDNDEKEKDAKKDKKRSKDGSSDDEKETKKNRTAGRGMAPDKRSRNLFAGMMGHLQRAKKSLDTERGSKAHELRQKAEERSELRIKETNSNIQELRKSQFEAQKKEEEAKMADIAKQIEEKELLLLQRRLESHYSLMMKFIRTQAEPTIFFLPAKHNKETEAKLEDTRGAIKKKIASLKAQLQPLPAEEVDARASAAASAMAAAMGETPKKQMPELNENDDDEASIPDTNKDKKDDDKEDKSDDEDDKDSDKDGDDKKKDDDSEAKSDDDDKKDD